MSENTYDQGDRVRVQARVTDPATYLPSGALVNPGVMGLHVRNPVGSLVSSAVVAPSPTGVFAATVDVPLDSSSTGEWSYRWVATGTWQGLEPRTFQVRQDPFG